MGIGDWIPEGIIDQCASMISDIANTVGETFDYTVELGAKGFNAISGKTTFDEAEKLFKRIETRYNAVSMKYKNDVSSISTRIEEKITAINYHKQDIYENHFQRFMDLANRVHNLTINGESFIEYFEDNVLEIKILTGLRDKSKLYKIDFNNLSFKEIAFSILTLGFSSRKMAKKTLNNVREEEVRIDEEITKMNAHVTKIKVLLESIETVEDYFSILVNSYERLLSRFEYGIKTQTQKQLLERVLLQNGKIDFRRMPIIHIEEFQALFNLSIVLKVMSTMSYINDDTELVKEDFKIYVNIQELIKESIPKMFIQTVA